MRFSSISRIVLCVSLLVAATASAGVEVRWGFTARSPGHLLISYHLHLVSGALEPGASFSQHVTFYDVQNLQPASLSGPPDWTVTIQSRGVDANDVTMRGRDDSARLLNVTWTWNGTTRIEAPADLGRINVGLDAPGDSGTFSPYRYVSQTSGGFGPTALVGYTHGASFP